MTLAEALRWGTMRLSQVGIESAALDASVLLCLATDKTKIELITHDSEAIEDAHHKAYEALVARREKFEPIAYITGEKEFWGLPFKVEPGVLIPRPDTETIVATLSALIPDRKSKAKIADLGVGSGALLVSILKEFPNFEGYGTDMSATALSCAEENAQTNEDNKKREN